MMRRQSSQLPRASSQLQRSQTVASLQQQHHQQQNPFTQWRRASSVADMLGAATVASGSRDGATSSNRRRQSQPQAPLLLGAGAGAHRLLQQHRGVVTVLGGSADPLDPAPGQVWFGEREGTPSVLDAVGRVVCNADLLLMQGMSSGEKEQLHLLLDSAVVELLDGHDVTVVSFGSLDVPGREAVRRAGAVERRKLLSLSLDYLFDKLFENLDEVPL